MTTQNKKELSKNATTVRWVMVEEPQEHLVVKHRLMIDSTGMYGAENLRRAFPSQDLWSVFLKGILTEDVGNINNIMWKRENVG
jgi:hypothetical protein